MLRARVQYAVETVQFGTTPGGYPNRARMIPVVVIGYEPLYHWNSLDWYPRHWKPLRLMMGIISSSIPNCMRTQ